MSSTFKSSKAKSSRAKSSTIGPSKKGEADTLSQRVYGLESRTGRGEPIFQACSLPWPKATGGASHSSLARCRKDSTQELLFDRNGFTAGACAGSIPNLKGCRFADVSDRAIDKATVHTGGVVATSADVSASERSVSTGVLLRQRVIHVAVPVDR
jgi:hypothetical protein